MHFKTILMLNLSQNKTKQNSGSGSHQCGEDVHCECGKDVHCVICAQPSGNQYDQFYSNFSSFHSPSHAGM